MHPFDSRPPLCNLMKPFRFEKTDSSVLASIPRVPGVYLFRRSDDEILYVGKSKQLRNRLATYLGTGSVKPSKTRIMLKKAVSFEIIVTETEKEALILEASIIKKYRPRYNILLRDDKAYPFLRLNMNTPFPRLRIVRSRKQDGALYFGPYPSAGAVKKTAKYISSIFGLRSCSDRVMKTKSRTCLLFQINRCTGPCCRKISRDEYSAIVKQVRLFLEGNSNMLIGKLTRQMTRASERLEFEKAAKIRDRIHAIERIMEKQSVVADASADWDILGLYVHDGVPVISLLRVRNGILYGQEIHHLAGAVQKTRHELLSSFICQFYQENSVPREVVLESEIPDAVPISQWLAERAGKKVMLKNGVRGIRRRLLKMAEKNAGEVCLTRAHGSIAWSEKAQLIADTLELSRLPEKIEGLDISTTGGQAAIGSLVVFLCGNPLRKKFRRYNIKEVEGIDDYAMIREVLERRLSRGTVGDGLPELLLIDGGRGQLGQAERLVSCMDLSDSIELVALAKGKNGEDEKIFRPGWTRPIILQPHDPVLLFLQRVRDEAHKFGIAAHRRKRNKLNFKSDLNNVPGIGPVRQRALLSNLGSLKSVRLASVDRLRQVPGISNAQAVKIYEYFHKPEK